MGKKKRKKKASPSHKTSTSPKKETAKEEPTTPSKHEKESKPSQQEEDTKTTKSEEEAPSEEETSSKEEGEVKRTWGQKVRSFLWQAGLLLGLYLGITTYQTLKMLPIGKKAPNFTLIDINGKRVTLSQFKGKRVILHFWTTWCSVCKMNMPTMKWISPYYKKDPVFLTVVVDGHRRKKIDQLYKEKQLNYPVLIGNQRISSQYKIDRFPTTYFLDQKGRIVSKDSGFLSPVGFWWRGVWINLYRWFKPAP